MNDGRKALDFGALDDFEPRKPTQKPKAPTKKDIDAVAAFPSREPADDAQINIKASSATVDKFRTMAKAERYTLGAFLDILLEAYENK